MLAGLAILIYQTTRTPAISPPPVVTSPARSSVAGDGAPDDECLVLDIRSPQQLPANLLRSISGQQSFPYWFRLKSRNACAHDVHLEVGFKIRGGPFGLVDRASYSRTLDRKQPLEENLPASKRTSPRRSK